MSLATKHVATVLVGSVMILALSFAFVTPAKADLLSDLQAQVQALLAQIAALQGGSTTTTSGVGCYAFTETHELGDSGGEIMWIQQFLNSHGAQVAASGAGSPGNETSYYGNLTRAAVAKWQAANGVAPAAGYWGPITRAKVAQVCAGSTGTGTGTGTTPVTGNGLKVMLASDSPASTALVKGQGIAELAKFTFSNPTGAAVTVTNLGFKRIGASTDSAVDNVYLYMGSERVTDPAGISTGNFNFNNSTGIFTIPAGGTVTVSVRADIDSAANGQQIGVQLVSVGSAATLDGSVVLPISGAIHLISSATIATTSWGAVTPSGATFAPQNDTVVFLSTLTVNTRAVWLKSIQFENRGSTKDADFQNFKLYVKGVQVGNTVSIMNDKVVFDLMGAPVKLETGGNEIKLVADVVGGSGETFDFQIRRAIDIMLVDSELNQPLQPGSFTAVSANTVEGVGLSVVKANTSPTDNVAVAATNVLWGRFEFRASGDDLKIEQITVDADTSISAGGLDNARIMLDGVQVGSTLDIAEAGTAFSLGSSMILKAGQTHVVEIYADAKTSTSTNLVNGETVNVGVSVATADTEGISSGDALSSAISEVESNTRTVASSSLTGSKASGYGNQTMVAGTNNARVGSFTFSTGSTEGVNINTIVLDMSSANAATITDLRIVDNSNGTQIGSTKSSPGSSNTFSINKPLSASQTLTVDVYANIKSGANAGNIVLTLDATSGGTGATTGQSVTIGSDATLQTITVAGSGTLTISRDAGTPANKNVIAGLTQQHVGKFNFDAANSAFTVQELQVQIPNGVSTSVANVTLKYKNQSGVEQTASQAVVTGAATGTATFTGLTFYVPMNDSADLDVYVDIPTVTSGAVSGAGVYVVLASTSFKAVDSAGSQTTTGTYVQSNSSAGYGTMYVKKSFPTIAKTTTGLANVVTAGSGVYRFTVTADSAGSIDLYQIALSVATTGATFATPSLWDVTGTPVAVGSSALNAAGSLVTVDLSGAIQEIGVGTPKTYELRFASITGWDNNDSITIDIQEDTSAVANAAAASVSGSPNTIWSDRSATSHSASTADWTNGYLVKDVDNDFRTCTISSSGTTCN